MINQTYEQRLREEFEEHVGYAERDVLTKQVCDVMYYFFIAKHREFVKEVRDSINKYGEEMDAGEAWGAVSDILSLPLLQVNEEKND